MEWHKDQKNVTEFAEFLVKSGQVNTLDELLDYFKHPEKYTEVWRLYQEEIQGTLPDRVVELECNKSVPTLVALVNPSSQCA